MASAPAANIVAATVAAVQHQDDDIYHSLPSKLWGDAVWTALYAIALGSYPVHEKDVTDAHRQRMTSLIQSLEFLLPCEVCRPHWATMFRDPARALKPERDLKNAESVARWLYENESAVAARIGKPMPEKRATFDRLLEFFSSLDEEEEEEKAAEKKAEKEPQHQSAAALPLPPTVPLPQSQPHPQPQAVQPPRPAFMQLRPAAPVSPPSHTNSPLRPAAAVSSAAAVLAARSAAAVTAASRSAVRTVVSGSGATSSVVKKKCNCGR
jgi:hypothetical protein